MNFDIVEKFFPNVREDVANKVCPICKVGIDPESFHDILSVKEYKISGMCQKCQDETFESSEED